MSWSKIIIFISLPSLLTGCLDRRELIHVSFNSEIKRNGLRKDRVIYKEENKVSASYLPDWKHEAIEKKF
ncbi:hypothetical protein NQZ71_25320 (plasmid) [Niallia taxi]|uniref:hypothetical protein n=1 Tax=Niallia taxi TaxID=2499688 RepID=UPI002934E677|nr:hypothetical protein [Niallia taxi]WOD65224.1 hypothetical protein NQZ71_25320 [Niallia taxi]